MAPPATAGTPHLVVDLSGLDFIDASCVEVLCQAFLAVRRGGGRAGLVAPRPVVARVLELLGADRVVRVHDSVVEAVVTPGG